jgi:hypothetical protein
MDLNTILPWSGGVNKKLMPKPEEQCWLAGTPYMEQMTAEQRLELLWQENARDVSMFITLEQTIPPLYVGYINQSGSELSENVYEYLMVFAKEEIIHTLMFKRYMKLAGLNLFSPPDGLYDLLTVQLPKMPPEFGIACTMIIEWVAEQGAMHASQHEFVDPMTRTMYYEHHVEESRHIAFGRWVTEGYLESAPEPHAARLRGAMKSLMDRLVPQFTFNPEIGHHVSFEFPIGQDDEKRIAEVRDSPSNKALNEARLAPVHRWLSKVGAV